MIQLALGKSSPLRSLKWTEIGASLTDATTHDDAVADLANQAEREYRASDAAMPKVTQALRDARDLRLVANRDNLKALGDFGYVVDDSPRPKPNPRAFNRRALSLANTRDPNIPTSGVERLPG